MSITKEKNSIMVTKMRLIVLETMMYVMELCLTKGLKYKNDLTNN